MRANILEVRLLNRPEEKRRLQAELVEYATAHRWSKPITLETELLLEEWITDIMSYAFEDKAEHTILVSIVSHSKHIEIETSDEGRAFNPLTLPPPDLTSPLEERQIGGVGIYMMRRLADEIRYTRQGTRNILKIRKSFEPKLFPAS